MLPLLLGHKMRQCGPHTVEYAVQVQVHQPVPLLFRQLVDAPLDAASRVVEQDVQVAVLVQGRGDHPIAVGADRYVGLDEERLVPILLDEPIDTRVPDSSTSTHTTLAPSRAKRRAVARPIPLSAPVTTATLSSSRWRPGPRPGCSSCSLAVIPTPFDRLPRSSGWPAIRPDAPS